MDSQHLQDRLTEIRGHIDDSKKKLVDSEHDYRRALGLLTDPGLRSSLMEQHVIQTERKKSAIDGMEELFSEVQAQLKSLQKSDL